MEILTLMSELDNCPSLGEFGKKAGLTARQVEQQVKELARLGYVKENSKGFTLTDKGKNVVKTQIDNPKNSLTAPTNSATNPQTHGSNSKSEGNINNSKNPRNEERMATKEITQENKGVPHKEAKQKNKTWLAAIIIVVIVVSAGLVVIVSTLGNNNQVQVSGTLQSALNGKLYFTSLDGKIQNTATVTNGHYSVLLVGGQSYAVCDNGFGQTIDGTFYPKDTRNNFYVPAGVTAFTKDFP
jgi:hypothetical protein